MRGKFFLLERFELTKLDDVIQIELLEDGELRLYLSATVILVQLTHQCVLLLAGGSKDGTRQSRLEEQVGHVNLVNTELYVARAVVLPCSQLKVTPAILHLCLLALEADTQHHLIFNLVHFTRLLENILFGIGRLLRVQVVLRDLLPDGDSLDYVCVLIRLGVERYSFKRDCCIDEHFSGALNLSHLFPEDLVLLNENNQLSLKDQLDFTYGFLESLRLID